MLLRPLILQVGVEHFGRSSRTLSCRISTPAWPGADALSCGGRTTRGVPQVAVSAWLLDQPSDASAAD
jgi:hypothetical protein